MVWEDILSISLSNPVVRSVITGVLRSIAGWVENSVSDGSWNFDFQKLAETLFRVLPQALGFSAMGIPPEAALVSDWAGVKLTNSMAKK